MRHLNTVECPENDTMHYRYYQLRELILE